MVNEMESKGFDAKAIIILLNVGWSMLHGAFDRLIPSIQMEDCADNMWAWHFSL